MLRKIRVLIGKLVTAASYEYRLHRMKFQYRDNPRMRCRNNYCGFVFMKYEGFGYRESHIMTKEQANNGYVECPVCTMPTNFKV